MEKEKFTNKDVQAILGLTKSQIIHWTRECGIVPDYQDAHGTGVARIYSRKNLLDLALVRAMMSNGISLTEIRGYFYALNYKHANLWRGGRRYNIAKLSSITPTFYHRKGMDIEVSEQTTYEAVYKKLKAKDKADKIVHMPKVTCKLGDKQFQLYFSPETINLLLVVVKAGKDVTMLTCTHIGFPDFFMWGDSVIMINLQNIKKQTLNGIK